MVAISKWIKAAPVALMLAVAGGPLITPPAQAAIGIGITVNFAPPVLPVYVQPPMPAEGYFWVPGYWAYGPDGYYWVPGEWELPPEIGVLWTPPYWGFDDGVYVFHEGYWGPHVGFYGGVDYGCGYAGVGYAGGYWEGGHLFYNRTVNNFGSVHVTNVYSRAAINNVNVTRVSYNGPGGAHARPNSAEAVALREHHLPPTSHQAHLVTSARSNPQLRSTAIVQHGNAVSAQRANSVRQTVASHPPAARPEPAAAPHTATPAMHRPAPANHFVPPRSAPAPHPATPAMHQPAAPTHRYVPPSHTSPAAAPHSIAPAPHPSTLTGRYPAPRPSESPRMPTAAPHPAPAYHAPAPAYNAPARRSYSAPAHFQPPARSAPSPAAHPAAAPRPAPQRGNPQHDQHHGPS